jgi:hypothetical protein
VPNASSFLTVRRNCYTNLLSKPLPWDFYGRLSAIERDAATLKAEVSSVKGYGCAKKADVSGIKNGIYCVENDLFDVIEDALGAFFLESNSSMDFVLSSDEIERKY